MEQSIYSMVEALKSYTEAFVVLDEWFTCTGGQPVCPLVLSLDGAAERFLNALKEVKEVRRQVNLDDSHQGFSNFMLDHSLDMRIKQANESHDSALCHCHLLENPVDFNEQSTVRVLIDIRKGILKLKDDVENCLITVRQMLVRVDSSVLENVNITHDRFLGACAKLADDLEVKILNFFFIRQQARELNGVNPTITIPEWEQKFLCQSVYNSYAYAFLIMVENYNEMGERISTRGEWISIDSSEELVDALRNVVDGYNTLGEHIVSLGQANETYRNEVLARFAIGQPRMDNLTILNLNHQHEGYICNCITMIDTLGTMFQQVWELVEALHTEAANAEVFVNLENAEPTDHLVESSEGQGDMECTGHGDEADASEEHKTAVSDAALEETVENDMAAPEATLDNDQKTAASQVPEHDLNEKA